MSSTITSTGGDDMMMPLSDGEQEDANNNSDHMIMPNSSGGSGTNQKSKKKNRKRKKKKIILPAGLKPFEKLYINSTNIQTMNGNNTTSTTNEISDSTISSDNVNNVEYIQKDVIQEIQKKTDSSILDEFKRIFDKFGTVEDLNIEQKEQEEQPEKKEKDLFELSSSDEENQDKDAEEDDGEELDYDQASLIANKKGSKKNKLKKKKKRKYVFTISQLKQLAKRPDVVEVHDITALDPKFLVFLKSGRNTVPVPTHWSQKRKYLQGKRGFVKPPFKLPEFIAKTGIQKMREAYEEKENEKSIKQKMRERVRPKLGKMDIDYQVLRDAFYKYQTKPDNLSIHGDLYYEGKEYEQRRKYINKYKAGKPLSERLRLALGMPVNAPPPWLIKMQEHGPPPSYINLKIPGLNTPIPEGASYGYHPGGWGRLPVDHMNRPLYNKFFGANAADDERKVDEKNVKLWGEDIIDDTIEEEEEQEESEEIREGGDTSDEEMAQTKEEDEEEENVIVVSGLTTPKPVMDGGHQSSSQRVPEVVNLRKEVPKKSSSDEPKLLYKVLEEKDQSIGSRDLMGSSSYAQNANMLPPSSQQEEDKKRKRNDKPSSQKKFKF